MGSDSDFPVVKGAAEELKRFGIPCEMRVISAHRTPDAAAEFAKNARSNGFGVIIAAAGLSAHLGGVLAAHTTLPVLGVPINAALNGLDALLSTVQMPPGVPVAAVDVNGARNAAVLAAQILSLSDDGVAAKLQKAKDDQAAEVSKKNKALQAEFAKI
jgi:5-(carboxyamino)imidazole ribonucleotide mutase